MDFWLFLFILVNLFISSLAGGIVFISVGYKLNRNIKLITAGWAIIGVLTMLATAGLVYLSIESGIGVVFLILLAPITILCGIIVTGMVGTINLIIGYRKKRPTLIRSGWICLIIHIVILTTVVLLLWLFTTGVIRINLM